MGGCDAVGPLHDGVAAGLVDVTYGDDLNGSDAFCSIEEVAHSASRADDADAESVVGAERAGGSEGGESAGDEKATTIGMIGHGAPVWLGIANHYSLSVRGCVRKGRWSEGIRQSWPAPAMHDCVDGGGDLVS